MSGHPISSSRDCPSHQMSPLYSSPSTQKAYLGRQVSRPEEDLRAYLSEILDQMAVNFSHLMTSLTKETG
jgi:hypothetical protein